LWHSISSGFWLKKFFFERFPEEMSRKSFFQAISSGNWLKKFFFKRFPEAFG
jgi:hypothetical protein